MRTSRISSPTPLSQTPRPLVGSARRGITMLWAVASMGVLLGFASLAVDWGRVVVARSEMQQAAEAAARYATGGLPDAATARTYAATAAAANRADGMAIVLNTAQDVEFGRWDPATRAFALVAAGEERAANAVRVTVRRTAARGNPMLTPFASFLGHSSMDVKVSAVASFGVETFGAVGLDYIRMGGNATASYNSTGSTFTPGRWGNIGSNGDITLSGSSDINGHARPGVGRSVIGGAGRVSGMTTPLSEPLAFPVANSSPYTVTNNNNGQIPSGSGYSPSGSMNMTVSSHNNVTLPGGVYYFSSLSVAGTLTFSGPATIYAFTNINITGNVNTAGNLPKNLKIFTIRNPHNGNAPGAINIGSSAMAYGTIYAPLSPATFSGSGDFHGSIVAKSIDMTGTSGIYYDLGVTTNTGDIALVQ